MSIRKERWIGVDGDLRLTSLDARPPASSYKGSLTIVNDNYSIISTSNGVEWHSQGHSASLADRPSAATFGKGVWQVGKNQYVSDGAAWKRQAKHELKLPPRPVFRKAMASPPTPTLTTALTIATPLHWPAVTAANKAGGITGTLGMSSVTVNNGGNGAMKGTAFPDYLFAEFKNITQSSGVTNKGVIGVSFFHYGAALELSFKGVTGGFLVKIDGEYLSLTPTAIANDGGHYYYYIPFGSSALRKIEFIGYNVAFNGIYTAQTDTIMPAPANGPRTIVIGDSFVEGTGSNQVDSFVRIFADAMGWDDVWASGVGSTGFLATAGGTKYKYRERVVADVIAYNPDMVIFCGSINDSGSTAAAIRTEADLLFAQVAAALPDVILCATSPTIKSGIGGVALNSLEQNATLRESVESFGGYFIDWIELPLPASATLFTITTTASAAQAATSITANTDDVPVIGATIKWSDNTRSRIKNVTGTGPFTITLDEGLLTAKASGATATRVGGTYLVGSGKVGGTTGYGNADVMVSSDGTHPSVEGHSALGHAMFDALNYAVNISS